MKSILLALPLVALMLAAPSGSEARNLASYPNCPIIDCDDCFAGNQICRIINCEGKITETYNRNCSRLAPSGALKFFKY